MEQFTIEHRNTKEIVCMGPRCVTGGLPDGRSALALPEGTEGSREMIFGVQMQLAQHNYHA